MENKAKQFILKPSSQCITLIEYAKEYVKENRTSIDYKVRNAVLIDSINYFGLMKGYDLLLTVNNLYNVKTDENNIDINELLDDVLKIYSNYIFEEGIVDSVLLNSHSHNVNEKFNETEGIIVLIDFINYISEVNNLGQKITLKYLYEKHQEQKHIRKMEKLKSFLRQSYEYYNRLYDGESIEEIYEEMRIKYELKNISLTGSYNYTDEARKKYGRIQMYFWDKIEVEKELYAMGYAYFKMYGGNRHSLKIKPIKQKINEMKK